MSEEILALLPRGAGMLGFGTVPPPEEIVSASAVSPTRAGAGPSSARKPG